MAIPSLPAGVSLQEHLSQLHQEYAEIQAQRDELQEGVKTSVDRCKSAHDALTELEMSYQKRQNLLPLGKLWIRKAIATINAFSNLYQIKSKLNDCGNDLVLLPEYQECIIEAELKRLDALEEVNTMLSLLRSICWTLLVVSLLQKRPSREQLINAISFALEKGLFDAKTLLPLRNVVSRIDIWIGRAQKCVAKTSGTPSSKVARLQLLMNEYSKLPLTCAFSKSFDHYLKSLEEEEAGTDFESLAQETVKAAEEALKATAPTAAPSNATGSAVKKRKSYTKKEKKLPGEAGAKKAKGNSSKASSTKTSPTASAAASVAGDDEDVNMEEVPVSSTGAVGAEETGKTS
jgi:hypothetical protein